MDDNLENIAGCPPLGPNDIYYVPYERHLVEAIDGLIDFAKKNNAGKIIQREKDWETVEFIIKLWANLYPKEYKDFRKEMSFTHTHLLNKNAQSEEKGGARIQHQLNLPLRVHDLIRAIFPLQRFDKKFTSKFAQRFPLMKVPDSDL